MLILALSSCSGNRDEADASGTFESTETIISAGASGVIKEFNIKEGQELAAGAYLGYIDTLQLHLKKKQLLAQVRATLVQKPDAEAQTAALRVQLAALEKEQARISNLVKANAATQKQLDDVNAQIQVLHKQIAAQASSLHIASSGISRQAEPLLVQVEEVNRNIRESLIVNPSRGTVLTKYAEVNEMTAMSKPLYRIADLSSMVLRAYVSGENYAAVRLGQKVKVMADDGKGGQRSYDGTVEWISDKAEFTPKTIQTRDERANLVYAVRIRVKNDGLLKIGMYADVKF